MRRRHCSLRRGLRGSGSAVGGVARALEAARLEGRQDGRLRRRVFVVALGHRQRRAPPASPNRRSRGNTAAAAAPALGGGGLGLRRFVGCLAGVFLRLPKFCGVSLALLQV
jgi:hypothetical protein